MPSPPIRILETKLQPPALVDTQLLRARLADQMAASTAKLVLVRAPAGFGKTTAMSQALRRIESEGTATAWITLDGADNDIPRFATSLDEAVARLALEGPHGHAPLDAVAALAAAHEPFVLFLDDFEVLRERGVLGLVSEVIEHLPRQGKVVLGSRSQPEIGLGRLRARGDLLEIDADSLRFDLGETKAFMNLHARRTLGIETLLQLHQKTEGWIAALWLASMALAREDAEDGFVARFSGSERALTDYLVEDVLSRQPQRFRDFLLRTSVLHQLGTSVCQVLCPRLDCASILEQLEANNLFLTRVTDAQTHETTWRYHSLFADFLRGQLAREQPDLVPRLHLMASGWYESQGRPVPAIDHAIEGGDYPLALDVLESHAERFLEQGRMRMLSRWFALIPEELLAEHPMLSVISAWATCFTTGPWIAMERLETMGAFDSPLPAVQANARALQPVLLAMQDHFDEAYDAGCAVLAQPISPLMAFARGTLLNAMAGTLSVVGDPRESHRLIETARQTQGEKSNFNRMYSESLVGIHDLHEGRLRQATARFRISVDSSRVVSYNHSHGNAWAGVLYASALYEANHLKQAENLLNVYLPLAREVGFADHMILSYTMRARLVFEAGDAEAAFECLEALEFLGLGRKLPRVVAAARLERSRLLVLQGNAPRSRDELMRADDPTIWDRERRQRLLAHDLDYLVLGRLRWDIHFGDVRATLPVIESEIANALRSSRHRRAFKLRVMRALALQRLGEVAAATQEMLDVLQATCPEGFFRLIADEGPIAGPLVERCSRLAQDNASASLSDPILAEYLIRLREALGPLPDAGDAAPEAFALSEPLTQKEIRVLQLLAEGHSNSAMSEKLFVSDSTVRTHLRNINAKMGTKSRTQALALARRLGVIH